MNENFLIVGGLILLTIAGGMVYQPLGFAVAGASFILVGLCVAKANNGGRRS